MPLMNFFNHDPETVMKMPIEQIVGICGDGNLKDNSHASEELRHFLSKSESTKLEEYISSCLNNSFNHSGFVLQDIVNEIGRRLDYNVTPGLYRGRMNEIGFDGIWQARNDDSIIIEVKTTDQYRISLETVVKYRKMLIDSEKIDDNSSILYVVGRNDTGDFEAQIRGSKYAWNVRVISADALIKLAQLKESAEDENTIQKIRSILKPFEYTRLDNLVDIVFSTAADLESASQINADECEPIQTRFNFTDSGILNGVRQSIVKTINNNLNIGLIPKTRALYWDREVGVNVACTISKYYPKTYTYWYAYHPGWDDFLKDAKSAYFALGCADRKQFFQIPWDVINSNLEYLNTTQKDENHTYWHVHIIERNGKFFLPLPKKGDSIELTPFTVAIKV